MTSIVAGLFLVGLIGWGAFCQLKVNELRSEISGLHEEYELRLEEERSKYVECREKLSKVRNYAKSLSQYSEIPDVLAKLERRKAKSQQLVKRAREQAANIIATAQAEAIALTEQSRQSVDDDLKVVKARIEEKRKLAESIVSQAVLRADEIVETANRQSKEIMTEARNEAKSRSKKIDEKEKKIDRMLELANDFVIDVRKRADEKAEKIGGQAYEALKRYEFFERARAALKIEVDKHLIEHMYDYDSILDEWAREYGHHEAGQMLKFARQRTQKLVNRDLAGDTQYTDSLRRQFAIHFLLDAFNGKVETLLSKAKSDNYAKLKKELADSFVIINANGRAFEHTRITDEYRDARIDELKWACVIQKVKADSREEQRAIRERIRDEERAKKEYERAIRQARKEEELLEKALAKMRLQYEAAASEDRAAFMEKIGDLEAKLAETDGLIRRTQSMAELTKRGYVYIISNIGSFGVNKYKIGLTRRLNPEERVIELGGASVPFRFDIHAFIMSDDAPALEYELHKAFMDRQVNKVNKRKEFFEVSIQEIRQVVESMGIEANWTMEALASEYHDTLVLEKRMKDDADLRGRWVNEQLKFEPEDAFDEDAEQELFVE
jgi:PHP family Zn ribbon phosphoesterase